MTSKPFVAASIVSGSIVVEGDPFDDAYWLRSYRGVELGGAPADYRHVLVYGCMKWSDEASAAGFESVVAAASSQTDSAAPRIVQRLGRAGRLRLLVLEPLEGIPLDRLVAALKEGGQSLPVALALALVAEVLPFVRSLQPRLQIFAGLRDLVLTPAGIVRARPLPTWAYCERHCDITNDPIFDTGMAREVFSYNPSAIGELGRSGSEHDDRDRIHIAGMLLRELLIGPLPGSFIEYLRTFLSQGLPSLQSLHPHLATAVATLVDRALARGAEDSFASWDDLLAGLLAAQTMFDPVERHQLVDLHDASPVPRRLTLAPPSAETLQCWSALPSLGYEPWPS